MLTLLLFGGGSDSTADVAYNRTIKSVATVERMLSVATTERMLSVATSHRMKSVPEVAGKQQ